MSAKVRGIITTGIGGILVDIECHLSNNLPNIIIVGFANKAVDEAKERIRGAFADSRIMLPRKRITVNLAPADILKADSGFDLAIAVSILLASEQVLPLPSDQVFIGELGLDGATRPVRGVIGKILVGRNKGITDFYIPSGNLAQAKLVPGVRLYPVKNLKQLYHHLTNAHLITAVRSGTSHQMPHIPPPGETPQISEIAGQAQAKRALVIAAAGGHNVFFSGPPGTGKSMLAKALPALLPPLAAEEMLEVTHLHSLASHDYDKIVSIRPFRSPHHSASHVAVIGGGLNLRPGEISLSHRGVLFFDELPEFGRLTLEALRQPLEDRVISVARAKDTAEYPADFILIATANPCPCGYYGTAGNCHCHPYQIARYRHKLSGPILDRIDLFSQVQEVKHRNLLTQAIDQAADDELKKLVVTARSIQSKRFGSNQLNASMSNADIRQFAALTSAAKELLDKASTRLNISARAYMRAVKVARTIADLEESEAVSDDHISEALAYRSQALLTE